NVAAFDGHVQILENANFAGSSHLGAVTGNRHELDSQARVRGAHQVAQEGAGSFQHSDQKRIEPGVVAGDFRAELTYALLDFFRRDQDLEIRISKFRHDSCL